MDVVIGRKCYWCCQQAPDINNVFDHHMKAEEQWDQEWILKMAILASMFV